MNKLGKKLRLGVLLPTRGLVMAGEQPRNLNSVLSMAEAVEHAGLDSVWVGDSLTAKPRPEPLTTLAAIASRTQKVRLGTAVLLAGLRHPINLAQAVSTLDLISEGRTVLAVGVGGAFNSEQSQEWRNSGVEPSHRATRLEEIISIVRGLVRGEEITYHGRHFHLDSISIGLKSPQPSGVPILIACHWNARREAQFRRAAILGDGFISISDYPSEYALVSAKVRGYASESHRSFDGMEAAFYMTVNLNQNVKSAADEANKYLHLYYGMNIWGDRWGPYGPPELTVDRIKCYEQAGARTIIVRFASFEQEKQLDTFLTKVVPEV